MKEGGSGMKERKCIKKHEKTKKNCHWVQWMG